jgi:hypothetical protein
VFLQLILIQQKTTILNKPLTTLAMKNQLTFALSFEKKTVSKLENSTTKNSNSKKVTSWPLCGWF